jgi:hypothetical protein
MIPARENDFVKVTISGHQIHEEIIGEVLGIGKTVETFDQGTEGWKNFQVDSIILRVGGQYKSIALKQRLKDVRVEIIAGAPGKIPLA